MRLICPNCGAQYEVPIEVIPSGGRDVQCSNCGHTWYQRHPDDDPELADELDATGPEPEWEPEPEPEDPPGARGPEVVVDNVASDISEDVPAPQQRGLDPSVAEVLREEAELEQRRREAEALESQPDLGLAEPDEDEQARRARQSRDRMAAMRGEPAQPSAAAVAGAAAMASTRPTSRRELLPDVEEINQTLRSTAEPRTPAHPSEDDGQRGSDLRPKKRSGGFGRGFMLVILLAAIAIGAYIFAPQISEAVPPVAPYLDSYVATIDDERAWLDERITALLEQLDSMSSESTSTPETEGN